MDLPPRTKADVLIEIAGLLRDGEREIAESDIADYTCIDCGFRTASLPEIAAHQRRQAEVHTPLQRLRRWWQLRGTSPGPKLEVDARAAEPAEGLAWRCHACDRVRPDAMIAVVTEIVGKGVEVNLRHCADRPECLDRAQAMALRTADILRRSWGETS